MSMKQKWELDKDSNKPIEKLNPNILTAYGDNKIIIEVLRNKVNQIIEKINNI